MKKFYICILIGVLIVAFGCKAKEKATEEEVKPAPFEMEGFVTVDEGVELRYKTIGDGPEAVIIIRYRDT